MRSLQQMRKAWGTATLWRCQEREERGSERSFRIASALKMQSDREVSPRFPDNHSRKNLRYVDAVSKGFVIPAKAEQKDRYRYNYLFDLPMVLGKNVGTPQALTLALVPTHPKAK